MKVNVIGHLVSSFVMSISTRMECIRCVFICFDDNTELMIIMKSGR